jgi:hypothetical protein
MDTVIINVFLAIVGAMILPVIPIDIIRILDNTIGRFILLLCPLLVYHYVSPASGVMVGVIVGLVIDRLHDLVPDNMMDGNGSGSGSGSGSGRTRKHDEVLVDLSPDYTKENSREVVMLEPIGVRRKHGVR